MENSAELAIKQRGQNNLAKAVSKVLPLVVEDQDTNKHNVPWGSKSPPQTGPQSIQQFQHIEAK